ncbi:hypothetical protein DL93DRAFT_2130483 [Clavulina sp. PMI_390]|nr:hypothetical protein DL93DRAFT_2130483 [Clavulina sp. PMI_390]
MLFLATALGAALISSTSAHISLYHPSMWGFNATTDTPFYGDGVPGLDDNRPVVPLMNRTFEQWWFHGYLNTMPPHEDDIMQLPAGGSQTLELACNKAYTSYWQDVTTSEPEQLNDPCPGVDHSALHTQGINDLGGCALAIAYESDASKVQPEDFTVFSVNQTCVWTKDTDFQVPADMPPCPDGKCTCAWFWIHTPDGGSEQNYMIAFQCNITNATGTTPVAKGNTPRRCGNDTYLDRPADPSNCTVGAKTPFYWFQFEQNNMFEDTFTPPLYTDLYGWTDGAQTDIFRSVAFGTDPNVTTSTSSVLVQTSTASPTSTSILASPSATQSIPLSGAVADHGICLRPSAQNTKPMTNLERLADALGLNSLRRRHEAVPRLRRRVSA